MDDHSKIKDQLVPGNLQRDVFAYDPQQAHHLHGPHAGQNYIVFGLKRSDQTFRYDSVRIEDQLKLT